MQAGFGVGRLHHVFSRQDRENIIRAAMDAGFRHFDLAPAYGDGFNERELGRILGARRSEVQVATKFGIPFRAIGELPNPIYLALRIAGKALRTSFGAQYHKRDFSPTVLVTSLEDSLRRLRTDDVDLLLIHEPQTFAEFQTLNDTWPELERQVKLGKLRKFGISSHTQLLLDAEQAGLVADAAVRMVPMCDTTCSLPASWFSSREVCVFNVVKHLSKTLGPGRIETRKLLEGFVKALPTCKPILSTHDLAEMKRMGEAFAHIPDSTTKNEADT